MTVNRFAFPLALILLAACGGPKTQYLVHSDTSELRLRSSVASVMVNTISLPGYAAADDISVQVEGGAVKTQKGALWADRPERTTTLAVARNLGAILGAKAAPEPWPLDGLPDATVDVRVEEMLAGTDGQFHLSGLYFVLIDTGAARSRAGHFDLAVPLAGSSLTDVADAQARAVMALSEDIARKLGR